MVRAAQQPSVRLNPIILGIVTVALLYFAKEILVPIALAILLAFLLTPVVRRLEAWKLGRVPSVAIALLAFLMAFGGIGWVVANQLIDNVNQLPAYENNIRRKLDSLRGSHGSGLAKAVDSIQEFSRVLSAAPPQEAPPVGPAERPVVVKLAPPLSSSVESLRSVLGPMVKPAGAAVLVLVFTIVMLIQREDLRNRLIRLLGQVRLNRVTRAFDDANDRVSQYLRMQFLVNAAYGALMAGGLYWIGVPSALLWGVLAGILRFVPYLGTIVGGCAPVVVALAVFEGWAKPLLCLLLFLVLEVSLTNLIEPWLYGSHTGISALAILVAAMFWMAVWGPVGLVLSTPITVCLLVVGRHSPQLEFLHVLLGDEPALEPHVELYQRLLAMDQQEARAIITRALKQGTLQDLYDTTLIPALRMGEEDRHNGVLDETRETFLLESINEFVAELSDSEQARGASSLTLGMRVVCLPANDFADELAANMLAQVLQQSGCAAMAFPVLDSHADVLDELSPETGDVVCISALPPFALMGARTLSKRLRARFPNVRIIVGLWSDASDNRDMEERLAKAFSVEVVTTLAQAVSNVTVADPRLQLTQG